MRTVVEVFTGIGWRRLLAPLLVVILAISLIGGIEAFVPTAELNNLDDAVTIDAVITPEQESERAEAVSRTGGQRVDTRQAVLPSTTVTVAAHRLAEGQVDFLLRNGGTQRAVHQTGPPTA
jgi:hypothetical protein